MSTKSWTYQSLFLYDSHFPAFTNGFSHPLIFIPVMNLSKFLLMMTQNNSPIGLNAILGSKEYRGRWANQTLKFNGQRIAGLIPIILFDYIRRIFEITQKDPKCVVLYK